MASIKSIDTLNKVINTLISWSGEPDDADESTVVINSDLPSEDITVGDLLELGQLVSILKAEILLGKGRVTFTDENKEDTTGH